MKKISLDCAWRKDRKPNHATADEINELLEKGLKQLNISHLEIKCEFTDNSSANGIKIDFVDHNAKVAKAPEKPKKKYDHYGHLKDKEHGNQSD